MLKNKLIIMLVIVLALTAIAEGTNATYDSGLGAPCCDSSSSPCVANSSLLKSRDEITGTVEPNEPNTIDSECADGTTGTYEDDESNENITLTDLNSTKFGRGHTVNISAWAYCYSDGSYVRFIYSNSTLPEWQIIDTQSCPSGGFHFFSQLFDLDNVIRKHSVRVIADYTSESGVTCEDSAYADHDDLIFPVKELLHTHRPVLTAKDGTDKEFHWRDDNITVKANVTHDTGRDHIEGANLSFYNGNDDKVVENSMSHVENITNGKTFEYNYTIPDVPKDERGRWEARVESTGSLDEIDENSTSFGVSAFVVDEDEEWAEGTVKENLSVGFNNIGIEKVIDSFEDGNVKEYQGGGSEAVDSENATHGQKIMETTTTEWNAISSDENMTEKGNTYTGWMKIKNLAGNTGLNYGVHPDDHFYCALIMYNSDSGFYLVWFDSSSDVYTIDSDTSIIPEEGNWYRASVNWTTNDKHIAKFYNERNELVTELSGTDANLSSPGGMGWYFKGLNSSFKGAFDAYGNETNVHEGYYESKIFDGTEKLGFLSQENSTTFPPRFSSASSSYAENCSNSGNWSWVSSMDDLGDCQFMKFNISLGGVHATVSPAVFQKTIKFEKTGGMVLNSPSDNSEKVDPVTFNYTPQMPYDINKTELYFNMTENATQSWWIENKSEAEGGEYVNTTDFLELELKNPENATAFDEQITYGNVVSGTVEETTTNDGTAKKISEEEVPPYYYLDAVENLSTPVTDPSTVTELEINLNAWTSGGDGYNVYIYDYTNLEWVDTGITVTATSDGTTYESRTCDENTCAITANPSDFMNASTDNSSLALRFEQVTADSTQYNLSIDYQNMTLGRDYKESGYYLSPAHDAGKEVNWTSSEEVSYVDNKTDWSNKSLFSVPNEPRGVDVGDGDNDTIKEIYVAGGKDSTSGFLVEANYSGGQWNTSTIGSSGSYKYRDIAFGDGDNDGEDEVYVAKGDNTAEEYGWNGSDWVKESTLDPGSSDWIEGVAIGDKDGDGSNEVYLAHDDHYIYEAVWDGSAWDITSMGDVGAYALGVVTGDIDEDDEDEVFSVEGDSSVWNATAFDWDGSSWSQTNLGEVGGTTSFESYYQGALAYGDPDNDGEDEVFATTGSSDVYKIEYSEGSYSKTLIASVGTEINLALEVYEPIEGKTEKRLYAGNGDENVYEIRLSPVGWETEAVVSSNGGGAIWDLKSGDRDEDGEESLYAGANDTTVWRYDSSEEPVTSTNVTYFENCSSGDGSWTEYTNISSVPNCRHIKFKTYLKTNTSLETPEMGKVNISYAKEKQTWRPRKQNQTNVTNEQPHTIEFNFTNAGFELPKTFEWNIKATDIDEITAFADQNWTVTVTGKKVEEVKWNTSILDCGSIDQGDTLTKTNLKILVDGENTNITAENMPGYNGTEVISVEPTYVENTSNDISVNVTCSAPPDTKAGLYKSRYAVYSDQSGSDYVNITCTVNRITGFSVIYTDRTWETSSYNPGDWTDNTTGEEQHIFKGNCTGISSGDKYLYYYNITLDPNKVVDKLVYSDYSPNVTQLTATTLQKQEGTNP